MKVINWASLGKSKVIGSSKVFNEMPKLSLNFRILFNHKINAVKKQW